MEITDIRLRRIDTDGKMKAVVSVTFDNEFVVHDIKVIESQNGLFIAMPSRKMGEGDFRDIAHPLTSETRNRIKEAIFEEYHKVLEAREAEKGQEVTAVETEEKEAEAAQAIEMYDEEVVPALKQK